MVDAVNLLNATVFPMGHGFICWQWNDRWR